MSEVPLDCSESSFRAIIKTMDLDHDNGLIQEQVSGNFKDSWNSSSVKGSSQGILAYHSFCRNILAITINCTRNPSGSNISVLIDSTPRLERVLLIEIFGSEMEWKTCRQTDSMIFQLQYFCLVCRELDGHLRNRKPPEFNR